MGFLQRLGLGRPSIGDRLNRLNHGAQLLMKHVGLTGRCDCVHMRDPDGGTGFLLQIQTPLLVPVSDREEFQQYFGRKLSQYAGLDDEPLILLIRDANDIRHAARDRGDVRSARIASILAVANPANSDTPPAEHLLARMRDTVRGRRDAQREARSRSDFSPLDAVPLTDLGALPTR